MLLHKLYVLQFKWNFTYYIIFSASEWISKHPFLVCLSVLSMAQNFEIDHNFRRDIDFLFGMITQLWNTFNWHKDTFDLDSECMLQNNLDFVATGSIRVLQTYICICSIFVIIYFVSLWSNLVIYCLNMKSVIEPIHSSAGKLFLPAMCNLCLYWFYKTMSHYYCMIRLTYINNIYLL